jgi:hypothetical protein
VEANAVEANAVEANAVDENAAEENVAKKLSRGNYTYPRRVPRRGEFVNSRVGEEHGDLFPLAFEGAFRGQNPLVEVFRGVELGGSKAGLAGG